MKILKMLVLLINFKVNYIYYVYIFFKDKISFYWNHIWFENWLKTNNIWYYFGTTTCLIFKNYKKNLIITEI